MRVLGALQLKGGEKSAGKQAEQCKQTNGEHEAKLTLSQIKLTTALTLAS